MRNLIVCCDGTWNDPGDEDEGVPAPTNVFRLFNAVDLDSPEPEQLTRYQAGVGTGGIVDKVLGGAVGWGLGEDIRDCYYWLAQKYRPGDRIHLFGFSRGAFTARSLAGMICRLGIVRVDGDDEGAGSDDVIGRVYRQGYRNRQPLPGLEFHEDSRRVEFIGVWDTVGALGIPDDKALLDWLDDPDRYRFHDTTLHPGVRRARHAVAIDERRGSFSPTLWDTSTAGEDQDVEQLWFPGAHSDVGGGYKEKGLSEGALLWMIEESRKKESGPAGVVYRQSAVDEISPDPRDMLHDSHTGMMKVLVTAPRAIPPLTRRDAFHGSVFTRRNRPPVEQVAYLRERPFVNGSVEFDVYAKQAWNWTGLYLEAGREYRFEAKGQWLDRNIPCGPAGARDGSFHFGEIAHLAGNVAGAMERLYRHGTGRKRADFIGSKRFAHADWFALIGAIADGGNPRVDGTHERLSAFVIGDGCEHTPERSGYLYCFANDAWGFYGNNRGFVTVTVTEAGDIQGNGGDHGAGRPVTFRRRARRGTRVAPARSAARPLPGRAG